MSNLLSLEKTSQLHSSSPVSIFEFQNQVYSLIYDEIPTKNITIQPSSITLYDSTVPLFIEKIKINPLTNQLFIFGFLPEKETGFYGISSFSLNRFQKFTIYPLTNVEKVEDILFLDIQNFLLFTSSKNNQLWILHPKYNNIIEIDSLNGKSFNIRESFYSSSKDQLDIYVDTLGSNFLKTTQLFRFSGSELLSSFI
jgi:hypothetical protein